MSSFDLGEQTIGGFPSSIEGSLGDPLAGLLADPAAEREFLLRGKPNRSEPYSLAFTSSPASYVNMGNVFNLILAGNFTIEILFWGTTATGGVQTFASKRTGTGAANVGWMFGIDGANNIFFSMGDGSIQQSVSVAGAVYMDGLVHRASVSVDRTSEFIMRLYIDGSLVSTASTLGLGSLTNAVDMRVGSLSGGGNNYIGNLADFRMWPSVRTTEQIDTYKFSTLASAEYSSIASVYMKMNDGTGTTTNNIAVSIPGVVFPVTGATWASTPGRVNVDLSTSGYISRSSDSPYKLFPSAIARPYNFSVSLGLPDLIGGSSLGIGDLTIDNPDGLRDRDATLDWLGADADMYIGRRGDALTSFTRFSRGKAAGVTRGLDSWSILYRDLRFKLQKRLQPNRYKGYGAALKFGTAGDKVSYGDVLDKTGTDSFTIEIVCNSSNAGAFNGLVCKGTFGLIGYNFYFTNANVLSAYVSNGTTLIGVTGPTTLLDGVTRRLSWVVDRAAQLMYLYVDGVLSGTSGTISAVTGTMGNALALTVGSFSDGSNIMVGTLDDFRFWPVARTQAQIVDTMNRELTATEATQCSLYSKFNEGTGTSASDSSGNSLTGTITASTWTSLFEGDAAVYGKPKPLLFGKRRQIPLTLVDSQRLVYQIHDGSMAGVDAVRIACDPLSFSSNLTDIYSAAPAAGQYNTCIAKGLVRIGTAPGAAAVTADARGDNSGPLAYRDTGSGIHRKIVTQLGGLADPADLDTASYAYLGTTQPATTGLYFTEEINIDEALDAAMKSINAWWSPSRVATVVLGRIDAPENQVATVNVTSNEIVDDGFSDEPVGVGRVGQVVLGYRPYSAVFSPDQIAGAVSMANRDDFGKDYRTVTATDPARTPDSDTLLVTTTIDDATAAQAEADRLLALWKVNRVIYKRELDTGLLAYFIGTVFNLTYDRYDTKYGKNMVAVGVAEDVGEHASADSISVTLFG